MTQNEILHNQAPHAGLALSVVFTTVQNTLLCLRAADHLTHDLSTRINLLVPEAIEHSSSTISPAMLADFTARYYLTMLPHAGDLQIKVVRYPAATGDLWEVLPPHSIIVLVGTTKHFWPSAEQRFARKLRHAGHDVLLFSTQCLATEDICGLEW